MRHRAEARRPRVLIVGGEDVDKRLGLMEALRSEFRLEAAGSEPALGREFTAAGFPYHVYSLSRGPHPVSDLKAYAQLRALFRRRSPDVVHAFATKPTVWGRLAANAVGVPVVIGTLPGLGSLYSSRRPLTLFLRGLYEVLQRRACHGSSLTVFQNRRDAEDMVKAGIAPADRVAVVPGSGVRTDLFDPARVARGKAEAVRCEAGVGSDELMVLMVSRVIRSKGVLYFVRAAEILRHRPELKFVLVGPDDRASRDRLNPPELERVTKAVRWLGRRDDIPTILAAADIFALPSFYREGVPRVLLEAASMGLPLVATQTPGCEDVVVPGRNGILVPPRDAEALAGAVVQLAGDAEARATAGRESRKRAEEEFALPVVARATAKLWSSQLSSVLPRPDAAEPEPRGTWGVAQSPRGSRSPETTG